MKTKSQLRKTKRFNMKRMFMTESIRMEKDTKVFLTIGGAKSNKKLMKK